MLEIEAFTPKKTFPPMMPIVTDRADGVCFYALGTHITSEAEAVVNNTRIWTSATSEGWDNLLSYGIKLYFNKGVVPSVIDFRQIRERGDMIMPLADFGVINPRQEQEVDQVGRVPLINFPGFYAQMVPSRPGVRTDIRDNCGVMEVNFCFSPDDKSFYTHEITFPKQCYTRPSYDVEKAAMRFRADPERLMGELIKMGFFSRIRLAEKKEIDKLLSGRLS